MQPNMEHLVNTALGAIDIMPDGSSVRIIVFDHDVNEIVPKTVVSAEGRAALKQRIRETFLNRGGLTNLAIPLTMAFTTETGAATMFLTDGLANRGEVSTSDGLIRLARKLPNYSKNVAHTLGLQMNRSDPINADLLKDLALDTSGVMRMGSCMEDVSSFVGDVMADHYLRRYEGIHVRLMSDALVAPKLVTPEPLAGFVLRADRELSIVTAWPAKTPQPDSVHVAIDYTKVFKGVADAAADASGSAAGSGPALLKGTVAVEPASDADVALILGAHAAAVLQQKVPAQTAALKASLEALAASPAGLGPLSLGKIAMITTEMEILTGTNDARGAETLYAMASGHPGDAANDTTPAVACMRVLSSTASQSQHPY